MLRKCVSGLRETSSVRKFVMWAPSVKPIKVVSSSEGELQLILIVDQQHQLVQDIATEENWVDQKDDKWCNHCGLFQRINSIRMEHCEHLFVGRMCHLERSPSHCVVVQVQGCVCVCGNAKYQKMDKCYLAYFKSFLSHSANTTFANRKCQTASFFRLGPILACRPRFLAR